MFYENDYILRMIRTMVRALASILFGKRVTFFEIEQRMKEGQADSLYARLIALAGAGQIDEAENQLYDALESGTEDSLETALAFYDYLNTLSDEFLEEHDFSREEIIEGVKALAERKGAQELLDAVMSIEGR